MSDTNSIYFKQLDYDTPESFANNAIEYCNNELWGNLGASVIIKSYKRKHNKKILDNYVYNLKYGTIAINEWSAIGFIIPTLPWGGYPGNKDNDIHSGQDYVHNSIFFESPLNGVVYSKFRMSSIIDPLWFVSNKKQKKVFRHLTYYQIDKSIINLLKLSFSALI